MRIDAYNQVAQIYKTNTKMKATKTEKAGMRDKVEISDFGKIYQTTKKAVNDASDIRENKVAEIKEMIDNGTYEVSNEDFANKLLENFEALY